MFPRGKSIHGESLSKIISSVVKKKVRASKRIYKCFIIFMLYGSFCTRNRFIRGIQGKKLHKSAQKGAAKIAAPLRDENPSFIILIAHCREDAARNQIFLRDYFLIKPIVLIANTLKRSEGNFAGIRSCLPIERARSNLSGIQ